MISNIVKYFCCEDISLIENYKDAVEDKTQIWDCHHRREISENKSSYELEQKFGIKEPLFPSLLVQLTYLAPVYEYKINGKLWLGLIEVAK